MQMGEHGAPSKVTARSAEVARSPNTIEDEGLRHLVALLDGAHHSFLSVSGRLLASIYASEPFLEAAERAQKRGVSFLFLTGPAPDPESIQGLGFLRDYIRISEQEPQPHYEVADGLHVRYEGLHTEQERARRNRLTRNVPKSARLLLQAAALHMSTHRWSSVSMWQEKR